MTRSKKTFPLSSIRAFMGLALAAQLLSAPAFAGRNDELENQLSQKNNDFYKFMKANPGLSHDEKVQKQNEMVGPTRDKLNHQIVDNLVKAAGEGVNESAKKNPKLKNLRSGGKNSAASLGGSSSSSGGDHGKKGITDLNSGPAKPEMVLDGSKLKKELEFKKQKDQQKYIIPDALKDLNAMPGDPPAAAPAPAPAPGP